MPRIAREDFRPHVDQNMAGFRRSVGSTIYLISSLLLVPGASAEGERCGRPGRPVNGTISPVGRFYFPGERVAYSCLEGFILFGDKERTCHKNGSWSGEVPLCDFNLARGKRTLQSATLWSYTPQLAVDGNDGTCCFTPKGPDSRWWQVHLGHKFNVMSVGITISPGSFQEFTIYVIELLADNKALYKPCTAFKGVFQTHKGLFNCNEGLGHPGQFVYIRDDRKEEEYFGLCEVEVFAYRERIPCGEPEVPVEGEVTREGEAKAVYSCNTGNKLEGDTVMTCTSKGKWQGQAPRCREVKCPAAPHIKKGYIEISNFRGEYIFGTEARYFCNPGHYLDGNETRVCGAEGKWSGDDPFCRAVSCGEPPSFPHTLVTLLSGSTEWNGIAVYTCKDGFRLHTNTGDTVTTCLDIGVWRIINVTCVPLEGVLTTTGAGQGLGRSLNTEDDGILKSSKGNGSTAVLVVILAVVAALLTITMFLVGILLMRRRMLSGPGSLSPLMRSPTKQLPFLNTIKKSQCQDARSHARNSSEVDKHSLSYQETMRPSSLLQQNLLASLQHHRISTKSFDQHSTSSSHFTIESEQQADNDYAGIQGSEPPYERVRCRSEHSYETIRKKSITQTSEADSSGECAVQDPGYETVGYDKESVGYETVKSRDPAYETVKGQDHDYETVKEKHAGYEKVNNSQELEYETEHDPDERLKKHCYETLKPKQSCYQQDPSSSTTDGIPDILQNLSFQGPLSGPSTAAVPPEILALYARIDKKKKKKRDIEEVPPSPPLPPPLSPLLDSLKEPSTDISYTSETGSSAPSSLITKELIRKFNKLSTEDEGISRSRHGSITSDCGSVSGTLRPLPPLPDHSN